MIHSKKHDVRTCVLKMPQRSRAKANRKAEDLVCRPHVSDGDVLDVLRLWHFKTNRIRKNVIPAGKQSVPSETLGLVRSRDGRILATRNTQKYVSVFTLLCKWMRQHTPRELTMPFPFTSISMNFDYAAKTHRDGNNLGPSMTKAFGDFTFGELMYWKDDDGHLPLERLRVSDAECLNTRRCLVLFDGLRAHAVSPFAGERHSLVFFSINNYNKAKSGVVEFLADALIEWPSDAANRYYAGLLGPARGYTPGYKSQSIRRFLCMAEKEQVRQWRTTTILMLGTLMTEVAAFIVTVGALRATCH